MITPPTRTRTRRTAGGQALAKYMDDHGVRPVAVYIPEALHRALTATAIEGDTPLQAIITLACTKHYGGDDVDLPPLVAPTRTKQDPHKSFPWYADIDLHKKMKLLAVQIDGSVQQLVLSAVVDYMKKAPLVKALKIPTGYAAYARGPGEMNLPLPKRRSVARQAG